MAKIHTLHDGDNIGSIADVIEIAHHRHFSSFKPIGFLPGHDWQQLEILPESGNLESSEQETDNGVLYRYQGRIRIHHPTVELDEVMRPFIGRLSVLRIRDMNGRYWVVGSPVCPVLISKASDTGQRYTDAPGNEYTFRVDQPHPAL